MPSVNHLHIDARQLAQRVVHGIDGIAAAQVRHTTLRVVLPAFQRHVAVIGNRVILRAVMRLVNADIDALRSYAGNPVRLKGMVCGNGLIQLSVVLELIIRLVNRLADQTVLFRVKLQHPQRRLIVHRQRVDLLTYQHSGDFIFGQWASSR